MVELSLSKEFIELKANPGELGRDLESDGDLYDGKDNYKIISKISFHHRIIMSNHSMREFIGEKGPIDHKSALINQTKIHFSVHPNQSFLVSICSDNELIFWSTKTHETRGNIGLKHSASCVKFSPNGNIMAIGYQTGLLELYSISFDESKGPIFNVEQSIQRKDASVIAMEFSGRSTLLCVSYNNKEQPEEGEPLVEGFVVVFKFKGKDVDPKSKKGQKEQQSFRFFETNFFRSPRQDLNKDQGKMTYVQFT